ncbi:MAG: universal stress protein [Aquincola sp.]|nr:universal stress protein [Aquincola sp.]MDH5329824.1 universal stress protein [Aquincola sp.]
MNIVGSIVVHVDAFARSEARLRMALTLAQAFRAWLTAVYAVPTAAYDTPLLLVEGFASLMPALERIDRERQEQARAMFDRVIGGAGTAVADAAQWVDAGRDPVYAALAAHALLADLVVFGQHDPSTAQRASDSELVASTLIETGAPGLVVPYAGRFDPATLTSDGLIALLAWKATREAARAVRAALPWLQRAGRIHLAVEAPDPGDAAAPTLAALRRWLGLHDCAAETTHCLIDRDHPGEALLSAAADVSADLLVMGCFGHSRARELVLGGASRTVLQSMTLPVLMAH